MRLVQLPWPLQRLVPGRSGYELLPSFLFALATICLYWPWDRFPRFNSFLAYPFARIACLRSLTGYFSWFGRPNSEAFKDFRVRWLIFCWANFLESLIAPLFR